MALGMYLHSHPNLPVHGKYLDLNITQTFVDLMNTIKITNLNQSMEYMLFLTDKQDNTILLDWVLLNVTETFRFFTIHNAGLYRFSLIQSNDKIEIDSVYLNVIEVSAILQ